MSPDANLTFDEHVFDCSLPIMPHDDAATSWLPFHDHENRRELGRARRKVITFWRRVALTVLIVGFAVGVLCIAAFAAANINNVQHENVVKDGR